MSELITPSQTVGPFFAMRLPWPDGPFVVPEDTPGAITIVGRVLDGAGNPIPDALIETWQADPAGRFAHPDDPRGASVSGYRSFRGFGRCPTSPDGSYRIVTLKPGPLPCPRRRKCRRRCWRKMSAEVPAEVPAEIRGGSARGGAGGSARGDTGGSARGGAGGSARGGADGSAAEVPGAGAGGGTEAPHLDVSVFARGMLDRLVTRMYFPDETEANAADSGAVVPAGTGPPRHAHRRARYKTTSGDGWDEAAHACSGSTSGSRATTRRFSSMSERLVAALEGPDGAPVVALGTSIGTTQGMWDRQAPVLRQRFRLLRFEMRGHGVPGAQSPAPPGPYTIAELGTDVLDLLNAHDIDRVAYCGVSLGGWSACGWPRTRPSASPGSGCAARRRTCRPRRCGPSAPRPHGRKA